MVRATLPGGIAVTACVQTPARDQRTENCLNAANLAHKHIKSKTIARLKINRGL
jgi:hypothetical protein